MQAPLYREDLQWHEQPHWYLLSAICCAAGSSALGLGLLSLSRRAVLIWITFLYVVGGLVFGSSLGGRYLTVTRTLWITYRRSYRPMWRLAMGREVAIELFGGWFVATMVGWRLGQDPALGRSIPGFTSGEAWVIGLCLGVQFGLWSGVTLMWPVYRWLKSLPRRGE